MDFPELVLNSIKVELVESEDSPYVFNPAATLNVTEEDIAAIKVSGEFIRGLYVLLSLKAKSIELLRADRGLRLKVN